MYFLGITRTPLCRLALREAVEGESAMRQQEEALERARVIEARGREKLQEAEEQIREVVARLAAEEAKLEESREMIQDVWDSVRDASFLAQAAVDEGREAWVFNDKVGMDEVPRALAEAWEVADSLRDILEHRLPELSLQLPNHKGELSGVASHGHVAAGKGRASWH